jgi:hypothetical protein
MSDKSQEAFEANETVQIEDYCPGIKRQIFARKGDRYEEALTRVKWKVWRAAEAYGRKQALEEAVELANAWAMTHVIEDNANLTVGDYIVKELMK